MTTLLLAMVMAQDLLNFITLNLLVMYWYGILPIIQLASIVINISNNRSHP